MIVHMLVGMNGGRYDGQSWPLPRVDFEVPDEEGEALVQAGVAVKIADSGKPFAPPPLPKVVVSEPSPTAAGPVSERPPAELREEAVPVSLPPELPPSSDDILQPTPTDPKAAWVAYAVSQGASQAEAESLTKNQLQSAYGGRL